MEIKQKNVRIFTEDEIRAALRAGRFAGEAALIALGHFMPKKEDREQLKKLLKIPLGTMEEMVCDKLNMEYEDGRDKRPDPDIKVGFGL